MVEPLIPGIGEARGFWRGSILVREEQRRDGSVPLGYDPERLGRGEPVGRQDSVPSRNARSFAAQSSASRSPQSPHWCRRRYHSPDSCASTSAASAPGVATVCPRRSTGRVRSAAGISSRGLCCRSWNMAANDSTRRGRRPVEAARPKAGGRPPSPFTTARGNLAPEVAMPEAALPTRPRWLQRRRVHGRALAQIHGVLKPKR